MTLATVFMNLIYVSIRTINDENLFYRGSRKPFAGGCGYHRVSRRALALETTVHVSTVRLLLVSANRSIILWTFVEDWHSIRMEDSRLCYHVPGQHNWRFYLLPDALLLFDLVHWYHVVLQHCGTERLYRSLFLRFYHPRLKPFVEDFVHSCSDYQKHKLVGRGYGEMPPREAMYAPFYEVAVNLIGP